MEEEHIARLGFQDSSLFDWKFVEQPVCPSHAPFYSAQFM
jgi:hypothetical protein